MKFNSYILASALFHIWVTTLLLPDPAKQRVSMALEEAEAVVEIEFEQAPPPKPEKELTPIKEEIKKTQKVVPIKKRVEPPKPRLKEKPILQKQEEKKLKPSPKVKWITPADYKKNRPPSYPRLSRRLGEQGTVTLKVEIAASGMPERVALYKSSGYSRLDEKARRAVEDWEFSPALENGRPITHTVLVPIKFEITG